jgi:hypothetical protein
MFIAHEIQNSRKPRRGGMGLPGTTGAAPMGLEGLVRGAVTTDMPLLWSWSD